MQITGRIESVMCPSSSPFSNNLNKSKNESHVNRSIDPPLNEEYLYGNRFVFDDAGTDAISIDSAAFASLYACAYGIVSVYICVHS